MSDGAANEARILISTDFSTMQAFVEFTKRGLDDIEKQGKSAFQKVGKEAYDFTRSIVGGAFISAGQDLAAAVTSPLRKGLQEIIGDAEKFRTTITNVAVAAGQDIKGVGRELSNLSKHIGEDVASVSAFVESVKGQTGNRKAAAGAVSAAKAEALARGYGSVTEMAGEVGQLQRRWKIEDISGFYNQQRSRASALGLDPNLAAETSKRMREKYEGAGMSAEAVDRLSNSLLRSSGGDMQMALKAGQEINDIVQGPSSRGYLEKTLGLKQGELLDDKFRPDVGRSIDLMQKFQLGKRGQKGLEYVARQHMSPTTAALFSRSMPEITSAMDAQRYVDPGTDLRDAESAYYSSPEGQAQLQRQIAAAKDRGMGDDLLPLKDKAGEYAGGWEGWGAGRAIEGVGIGGALYASKKIATGLGKRLFGKQAASVATKAAGGVASRAGIGALGVGARALGGIGALLTMEGEQYTPEEMARAYQHEQPGMPPGAGVLQGSGAPPGGWSGPGFGPMLSPPPAFSATPEDPRQAATEQAKQNAEELRHGQAIPIRGTVTVVIATPPLTTGQGSQR